MRYLLVGLLSCISFGCARWHGAPEEELPDCVGVPVSLGRVGPDRTSIELVATRDGFVVGFTAPDGYRVRRLTPGGTIIAEGIVPSALGTSPPQLFDVPDGLAVITREEGQVVGYLLGDGLEVERRVEMAPLSNPRSGFRAVSYPEAPEPDFPLALVAGGRIFPLGTSFRSDQIGGLSWNGSTFSTTNPLGHGLWNLNESGPAFDRELEHEWDGVPPRYDAGFHFAPDAHLTGRHAGVVSQRLEVQVVIQGRDPLLVPLLETEPGYSSIDWDGEDYVVVTSGSLESGESGLLSFRVGADGSLTSAPGELLAGDPADYAWVTTRSLTSSASGAAWVAGDEVRFACFPRR